MSELQDDEKISAELIDENQGSTEKIEPASQALLDLEALGLTPEDMAAAVEAEKKAGPPPPLVALPRFRWLALLLLAAAGGLALAFSGKGENLRLWGLAGLILLLLFMSVLPAARLLPRLPTRGGLAAAIFSAAIFVQILGGLPEAFFTCPTALAWAGLLTLALLWTAAAVIRKLGRCRPLAILAGLFLIQAALGPIPALFNHSSPDRPGLTWEALNASPAFLTEALPWFLWPMALTLGLALPLAALLALSDQWSSLRRPGARHGGNFFLALAWLGLLPSGLLLFPPAADNYPELVQKVRETAPIIAGVEAASPTIPAATAAPPPDAQTAPEPAAVPAEPTEQPAAEPPPAAAPPDDAPAAPAPSAPEKLSTPDDASAPASPASPPATGKAPPAAAPPDNTPAARLEELHLRNENLQLRVDDLESRLQILSDRLNQLERPEQTRNLTPPLPPELENTPPDQPLPPPLDKNNYSGGSAT
jgi:hypothetical protein